ncbi:SAM-dependent methyltransferase [Haloechinothrix halophila]|uniref:SAM-dependent methyltransferase n=1 Tax=Haloechinothrix halophila TaxID=1069073 RepID=UPI00041E9A98|nr:class I SAM-dependent methyltransferase [Haloechinothrix halophila]
MRLDSEHPDRLRWNARYGTTPPDFVPHQFAAEALRAGIPDGRVLELACGRSGTALALAEAGRDVVAVDVSDLALSQLADEASRRGLRVECVLADARAYTPEGNFALVVAIRYWDQDVFARACQAVTPGGLLQWEALADPDGGRFRVTPGELSARLPEDFQVLSEQTASGTSRLTARRVTPVVR